MGPTMGHAIGGVMCVKGHAMGGVMCVKGHAMGGVMCVKGHHMGGVVCSWVITWVGSCVRGSLHGWGHVWGRPSDNGATHSGKGSTCSKLFVRQGFCGWPGGPKLKHDYWSNTDGFLHRAAAETPPPQTSERTSEFLSERFSQRWIPKPP